MSTVTREIDSFFGLKQKEDEGLINCNKQFKAAKDVMLNVLGGQFVILKVVRAHDQFVATPQTDDHFKKNTEIIEEVFKRLTARMFMKNADWAKCGSILKGLKEQKALDNNQYPATLVAANNVLSVHSFDPAHHERCKQKTKEKNKNKSDDKPDQKEEPEKKELEFSFATVEGGCCCCGKKGHRSNTCNLRDEIPKAEWAINKAAQNFVQMQSPASSVSLVSSGTETASTAGSTNESAVPVPQQPATRQATSLSQFVIFNQITEPPITDPNLATLHVQSVKDIVAINSSTSDHLFANSDFVSGISSKHHVPLSWAQMVVG